MDGKKGSNQESKGAWIMSWKIIINNKKCPFKNRMNHCEYKEGLTFLCNKDKCPIKKVREGLN